MKGVHSHPKAYETDAIDPRHITSFLTVKLPDPANANAETLQVFQEGDKIHVDAGNDEPAVAVILDCCALPQEEGEPDMGFFKVRVGCALLSIVSIRPCADTVCIQWLYSAADARACKGLSSKSVVDVWCFFRS